MELRHNGVTLILSPAPWFLAPHLSAMLTAGGISTLALRWAAGQSQQSRLPPSPVPTEVTDWPRGLQLACTGADDYAPTYSPRQEDMIHPLARPAFPPMLPLGGGVSSPGPCGLEGKWAITQELERRNDSDPK